MATAATTFVPLRGNDGGNTLRPANGGLLTAWVQVPTGTPGGSFCAALQMESFTYSRQGPTCTPLTPETWTQISVRPSSTLWSGHRALGIQLTVTNVPAGSLHALLDDVQQSL